MHIADTLVAVDAAIALTKDVGFGLAIEIAAQWHSAICKRLARGHRRAIRCGRYIGGFRSVLGRDKAKGKQSQWRQRLCRLALAWQAYDERQASQAVMMSKGLHPCVPAVNGQ
jgi:hypothetical protein